MKKILFVITKANWGGAQRYVFDLATNLPKDEFEIAVACGGSGILVEKLRQSKVVIYHISSLERDVSIGKDIKSFLELYRLFKKERPDVVHLNSSKAGGIGALAARLAGIQKIIFTSHGLAWQEDRNILSRAAILFASWVTFTLCHRVILITTDSYNRAWWLPLTGRKLRLIHNGIGHIAFKSGETARAQLQLPAEVLVIGTVAELTWNKGLHHLIKAAGALHRRGENFQLCIIGEGEERDFLEMIIEEEGLGERARLFGFIPHANELLPAFDIFVLPSVKEGLPYALLEAGLAGLGVIASRVGGVPDVVGDGISGLLIAPKNEHELEEKLGVLAGDSALRARLAEQLRERVADEFSLQKMIEQTKALYEAQPRSAS